MTSAVPGVRLGTAKCAPSPDTRKKLSTVSWQFGLVSGGVELSEELARPLLVNLRSILSPEGKHL